MKKKSKITRLFTSVIPRILLVILLSHIIALFTIDRWIEYKTVSFRSSKVPAEMAGYKIAFIADTHNMEAQKLRGIVQELNQQQLDLLLLGGDFSNTGENPWQTMEILSQVVTTDGIYGVEGNHDNYRNLFASMKQYSIQPLSNNGVHIRKNFYLAGVEDLWRRRPNVKQAIAAAEPDDFVLLVSHNPDLTMLQDTSGVDLVMSGHTHGGQITFFGLWAPALSPAKSITKYGQRFMSGWAKSRDGIPVYVSNGTGSYVSRVFARPQVILFTLSPG